MTTGDGSADPRERACKNPDCNRRFVPAPVGWNRRPAEYCNVECRSSALLARRCAAAKVAREATAATADCVACGKPFAPRSKRSNACSLVCRERHKRKLEIEAHGAERVRLDASKAQALPAAPKRCPDCGARAVRDEDARGFFYCADREHCDWSVLLTAKSRDPRADTPDPEPDHEEETMREYDPDDQDDDEERDEEEDDQDDEEPESVPPVEVPAAKPAKPARKLKRGKRVEATKRNHAAVLAALADGAEEPHDLSKRTGLKTANLYQIINRLLADGTIHKAGSRNRPTYHLTSAPKPAPIARPAPSVRKPDVSPTLDSLRAQVAALALPDLLTLLGDLAPLLGPLAALREAHKGLQEDRL